MVNKAKHYTMVKNRNNTLDKYQLAKLYKMKEPNVPDKHKLKQGLQVSLKKNSVAPPTRELDQKILVEPHQVVMPKNQR